MNKTEFLQGLGLAPPEGEPQEIVIPADKLDRVAPQNEPAPKPKRKRRQSNPESATKEREFDSRLAKAEAKLSELGDAIEKKLADFNKWLEDLAGKLKLVQDGQPDNKELKTELKTLRQNDAVDRRVANRFETRLTKLETNSKKVKEAVASAKKEGKLSFPFNILFGEEEEE